MAWLQRQEWHCAWDPDSVARVLVDADGDTAIGGTMMTPLDRDGGAVERTLTNTATGLFELRAPGPGEYRVRAERIGYATTFSAFFTIAVRRSTACRCKL